MHDAAVMIAKIVGPFMFILGIWFLTRRELVMKLRESGEKNEGIIYMGAVLNLLIGLIILNFYNVWHRDLTLVVTLFGWFQLIRGIYMLFFPTTFFATRKSQPTLFKVLAFVPLIWGILLLLVAYRG